MDTSSRFDEIIAGAVDRHAAEQRALAQTLQSLRSDIVSVASRVSETNTSVADVRTALEDVRTTATNVQGAVAHVEDETQATSADLEALATAVVALSNATKDRITSLEQRLTSLATTLSGGLRDLATSQVEALEDLGRAVSGSSAASTVEATAHSVEAAVQKAATKLATKTDALQSSIEETAEIVGYLRDQADDLDRALTSINTVGPQLETIVTDAMRRAASARTAVVKQAQDAVEGALGPVAERVDELIEVLSDVPAPKARDALAAEVRRLGLAQIEITSRLDDLSVAVGDLAAEQAGRTDEILDVVTHLTRVVEASRSSAPAAAVKTPAKAKPAARAQPKPVAKAVKTTAKTPAKAVTRTTAAKSKAAAGKSSPEDAATKPAPRKRRGYIPV